MTRVNCFWAAVKSARQGNVVNFFKFFCFDHSNCIPCEFCACFCTNLASYTFIMSHLNRRNRDTIFFSRDRFDAIHWAKWYTDLTPGAVVLINNSNQFRFFLLKIYLFCWIRYSFVVVVFVIVCHFFRSKLSMEVKRNSFLSAKGFLPNRKSGLILATH